MSRPPDTGRFPAWVYRHGSDPDPRFSLANERTFLAWIRTALALFAAGVALEALVLPIQPGWRTAAAVVFVLLGLLAATQAWLGWARTERALRDGRTLPGPSLSTAVVAGVLTAMALVAIGLWLR
jgi:putative membrane protein